MKTIIFLIALMTIDDLFIGALSQKYSVEYLDDDSLEEHIIPHRSVEPPRFFGLKNLTSRPTPKFRDSKKLSNIPTTVSIKPGKVVELKTGCRGMTSTLHKMGREVICKPRKSLVKLTPDPGFVYIPDVILIERCDGRCGHYSQSCMAIESTTSKVLVQRMQIGSLESPCYELEVEKHTRCKCGCDLLPSDCNSRQKYNEQECTCDCININEQFECTMKDGMFWNRETCRCQCSVEEETCSTGLMWIPSICSCAKVMMDNNVK